MTQTVCNNFSHVLCLQPGMSSLTPSSLPGGVWWQNSGGWRTVRDAHSGHCAAGSVWPHPESRAFCTVLPPFDAHFLCVYDSALSAPHSATHAIKHPSPFFKGKILHLLHYFFTDS